MALESSLWKSISKARHTLGDCLHMDRIENMLMKGMPDVEGFINIALEEGADISSVTIGQFWLELKSSERPAKTSTPVRFKLKGREEQIRWMARRWNLGGNAFFLLQVGSGADLIRYALPGNYGDRLFAGMTEAEIAVEAALFGEVFARNCKPEDIFKRIVRCRRKVQLHG
jgi:hypothetical protein